MEVKKNLRKNKKTPNYNPSGHIKGYIIWNLVEKEKEKKKLKSYILWVN
jgi:hypothetical protein